MFIILIITNKATANRVPNLQSATLAGVRIIQQIYNELSNYKIKS
ncbi:hypothetical protein SAMN05216331_102108 [Porphyromonadaceae bacterium KH3R12]|nr:hypothetical protein SAMN05216331_102108 [Porphyromonadaceae bacterium KH3R12]